MSHADTKDPARTRQLVWPVPVERGPLEERRVQATVPSAPAARCVAAVTVSRGLSPLEAPLNSRPRP